MVVVVLFLVVVLVVVLFVVSTGLLILFVLVWCLRPRSDLSSQEEDQQVFLWLHPFTDPTCAPHVQWDVCDPYRRRRRQYLKKRQPAPPPRQSQFEWRVFRKKSHSEMNTVLKENNRRRSS